jgi:hypothetical protein
MLKKFGCAVAVLLVGSIALAETVRGVITEIKDDEITVNVFKKKGQEPEKKTYKIDAKKVKVVRAKGKDDTEDSSLKALKEVIAKSKGRIKGAFATIEVKDGTATEIKFRTFGGKKKKKKVDD